jgi:hypothetical protein
VSDFTHRDRRAHRDVTRSFWTVVAVSLGLTAVALELPLPYAGIAAVVALGVLGVAYLGWSERFLSSYSSDLRHAREGTAMDGFIRAEVASAVGLDRDGRSGSVPSPHVRRGVRRGSLEDAPEIPDGATGRGQA